MANVTYPSQPKLGIDAVLDQPIWHALTTEQKRFAEGDALARRYLPQIAPFGAVADQSPAAYAALAELVADGVVAVEYLEPPAPPAGWEILDSIEVFQMVWEPVGSSDTSVAPDLGPSIRELKTADVPAMLALTALTEPGPFRERTIELGTYIGMFAPDHSLDGRLVAMAGERMRLPGCTEVSAVCTHPDFRGRGYGNTMVNAMTSRIAARGDLPFLHVRAANAGAVRVYERLGFRIRAQHYLVPMRPTGPAQVPSQ